MDPASGDLKPARAVRKRQQLYSLVKVIVRGLAMFDVARGYAPTVAFLQKHCNFNTDAIPMNVAANAEAEAKAKAETETEAEAKVQTNIDVGSSSSSSSNRGNDARGMKIFSLAEIEQHSSEDDCWMASDYPPPQPTLFYKVISSTMKECCLSAPAIIIILSR